MIEETLRYLLKCHLTRNRTNIQIRILLRSTCNTKRSREVLLYLLRSVRIEPGHYYQKRRNSFSDVVFVT